MTAVMRFAIIALLSIISAAQTKTTQPDKPVAEFRTGGLNPANDPPSAKEPKTPAEKAAAREKLHEVTDEFVGSQKRLRFLIKKMTAWYQVDENHPDAIEAASRLRSALRMYSLELSLFSHTVARSQKIATKADLAEISQALADSELALREIRQLKAMGFTE